MEYSQAKTRQTLWLPLTDEVGTALANYLKQRPSLPYRQVFMRLRPPIGPLSAQEAARSLARAARVAGLKLPTTRFHSLRHAVALRLLRQGAGLKSISDLLGHRDPNTTADSMSRISVKSLYPCRALGPPTAENRRVVEALIDPSHRYVPGSPLRRRKAGRAFWPGRFATTWLCSGPWGEGITERSGFCAGWTSSWSATPRADAGRTVAFQPNELAAIGRIRAHNV